MTSYKKTLFSLSLITLLLTPLSGLMACWGCLNGSEDTSESEKTPLTRESASINTQPKGPPSSEDLSRSDLSAGGSGNLTVVNMSRMSTTSIPLPINNDDLFPHLLRHTELDKDLTIQKSPTKFVLEFYDGLVIALFYVKNDNITIHHKDCLQNGTLVDKSSYPLVSSLIVGSVRDSIFLHHKEFSKILNAALQGIYDVTTVRHRLSTDEQFRQFTMTFDEKTSLPNTSYDLLYGFSGKKNHPSMAKRLAAYQ